MADYLKSSAEDKPNMDVEVWLDGKKVKEVRIDATNLFTFDNKLVLDGDAVESGVHEVELRKTGRGPVYFNVYSTNFTLEDFITKAGLEVKVNRKFYKLTRVDKTIKVEGYPAWGQSRRTFATSVILARTGQRLFGSAGSATGLIAASPVPP
jgi:hypothetical protein